MAEVNQPTSGNGGHGRPRFVLVVVCGGRRRKTAVIAAGAAETGIARRLRQRAWTSVGVLVVRHDVFL